MDTLVSRAGRWIRGALRRPARGKKKTRWWKNGHMMLQQSQQTNIAQHALAAHPRSHDLQAYMRNSPLENRPDLSNTCCVFCRPEPGTQRSEFATASKSGGSRNRRKKPTNPAKRGRGPPFVCSSSASALPFSVPPFVFPSTPAGGPELPGLQIPPGRTEDGNISGQAGRQKRCCQGGTSRRNLKKKTK